MIYSLLKRRLVVESSRVEGVGCGETKRYSKRSPLDPEVSVSTVCSK